MNPPLNMKSTFIPVCGLIAALIAVQPAFAKDKAAAQKPTKPGAVAVHGRKPAAKPRAIVKPSPPKQPWVGRNVTISPSERHVIRAYVFDRVHASKGGKFNGVPQGLARKVSWTNKLPYGWEKNWIQGEVLPAEIHELCQPLPHDIIVKLPPPPPGTVLLAVDGKILRVAYPTYQILDLFDVFSPAAELMGLRPARPAAHRLAAAAPKSSRLSP